MFRYNFAREFGFGVICLLQEVRRPQRAREMYFDAPRKGFERGGIIHHQGETTASPTQTMIPNMEIAPALAVGPNPWTPFQPSSAPIGHPGPRITTN